jgi:hypothetical protein
MGKSGSLALMPRGADMWPRLLVLVAAVLVLAQVAHRESGTNVEPAVSPVVIVPAAPTVPIKPLRSAEARAKPGEPPRRSGPAESLEDGIGRELQEASTSLRYVRRGQEHSAVICGELSIPSHPSYRRFVWMSSVRMLAVDDGSSDYDKELMPLCG